MEHGKSIMEVRLDRTVKTNGINALIIFFLGYLPANSFCKDGIPVNYPFSREPFERALTVYSFPIQKAQTNFNFNFNFNLKPFLSMVQPEINYRVTSNYKGILGDIGIYSLPSGLTQVYEGEGLCSKLFSLNFNQSCTLRFYVDKNMYSYRNDGWLLMWPVHVYAFRPAVGSRFNDLVARLPGVTQLTVISENQNGLHYDPATMSITGTPARPGIYHFQVIASNGHATTAPQDLQIDVTIDPKDTPLFKMNHTIASAMPDQHYHLNLLDLIKPTSGFMENNQISFRIDPNFPYPNWLSIDAEVGTFLQGIVPTTDAGLDREVTLIASSNTGGDSLPLTIKIPVAYDPSKKPIVEKGVELTGSAGNTVRIDFRANIIDPSTDGSLKIMLDKIEPAAPWLSISSLNSMELNGVVPKGAEGQEYQITLHANTAIGGNSDARTIPLKIATNENLTPRFYAANPQLPLLYVGQPYSYDFVGNQDVHPQYSDIPYTVELAEGHNNPAWLRIEDNKLIVDSVPSKLEQMEQVFITIKNIPGGSSEVLPLKLFTME